jgi:O-antigen/teichoic acid export membrane protein
LLLSGINIVCCGLIGSLCQSLLEANYKIYFVNVIFFFRTALHYSAVFLVSIYSSQVEHLIYATNLVFITFVVVDIFSVKILTEAGLASPRWCHIKAVLHRGKDFFAIGLATSVLQPLTRYLVALLAVDMAANGVYDISLKIAMMAAGALSCFSVPLYSLFSGYGEKQIGKIKRILYRMTPLLMVLFTLGATIYLFTGEALLEFVFGAVDPLLFHTSLILLLGRALSAVFEPYARAMWALGHTKKCIAVKFWGLFMTIVLFFALSFIREPLYRIAISFVTPMLCGAMLLSFLFYRLYGLRSISLVVSEKTTNV